MKTLKSALCKMQLGGSENLAEVEMQRLHFLGLIDRGYTESQKTKEIITSGHCTQPGDEVDSIRLHQHENFA
jgi:hypothetical protein